MPYVVLEGGAGYGTALPTEAGDVIKGGVRRAVEELQFSTSTREVRGTVAAEVWMKDPTGENITRVSGKEILKGKHSLAGSKFPPWQADNTSTVYALHWGIMEVITNKNICCIFRSSNVLAMVLHPLSIIRLGFWA